MAETTSLLTDLGRAPGAAMKQVRRVAATAYYRRYFRSRPDHPALDPVRAARAVRDADSLLFCCWGNICRSPMAARRFRELIEGSGRLDLAVGSAGLGERSGRPSPPNAVEVAARYGVDLAQHSSRCATARTLAESDVTFVMDFHTYHLFRRRHPDPDPEGVFFLSAFTPGGVEIADPAGESRHTFERVYARLATATDRLAAAATGAQSPARV